MTDYLHEAKMYAYDEERSNMSKLFETDFVIVYKDNLEPYEDTNDLTAHIYDKESVEQFELDGGTLESTIPDCKWLPMTELSKDNQNKYIDALEKEDV